MACPPNCHFCLSRNKETAVTPNEKHRLEVVIEQKDSALADATKRAEVYRDALVETGQQLSRLVDKERQLNSRIAEQNEWLIRLQEEIRQLKSELESEKACHIATRDAIRNRLSRLVDQI